MIRDTLNAIFDLVDLPTLCASTRVSRLWRLTARDHPTYWKNLTLDALCMSAADVLLFLDRLTAKDDPDATIRVSLRCTTSTSSLNRLVLGRIVLPVVRDNMHRVEEVAFVVSPAFAAVLWPLFSTDAPRLRGIHVIVDGYAGDMEPIPSLFNAHAHDSLERVLIRNVPLPEPAFPLRHTLKSLEATYTIYDDSSASSVERVLSWFPHTQTLDLRPIDRRYRGRLPRFPDLIALQLCTLHHLVIHHEKYLLGIPHTLIPILSVRAPVRGPGHVRQLIPKQGLLAVVFRVRMDRNLCYAMTGRVVVTTVDGDRIREFARQRVSYIESPSFLEEVILSTRLVSLTIPLAVGFRTLCEEAYFLPKLTTLRLLLNAFPDPVDSWSTRALVCPKLSSLILQREVEELDAYITLAALRAFARMAIAMDVAEAVDVVLEDIRLVGDEGGEMVNCRTASAPWDAVIPDKCAEPNRDRQSATGGTRFPPSF
ncbi:hypothetical protein AURDEDRAFT_175711 [Auricularia subglabra TFB-10046 SS5]|nr:hypothetical protein AURDEDRAFT_175711 [Auricularia subglabra TFB-10046 SS5]